MKLYNVKGNLEEELSKELEEPLSPGCRIDPNMNCQFCVTHHQKAHKCWLFQPENYVPKLLLAEDYTTPNKSPIESQEDTTITGYYSPTDADLLNNNYTEKAEK